jgi:hypothetical protein
MVNPAVMMLVVLGLFVWMLFHPQSTAPVKIFLLMAALMLFGPVSNTVMDAEAAALPWKLDYSLYLIDRALGVSAFSIARHLSPWQRDMAFIIYLTLGHWMMVWYALSLTIRNGRPKPLLISYVVSYGLAPLFYLVVPACGPAHAFGRAFPMGNPEVAPVPIHLDGWPNAIPSLHFATAILFVHFAGKNRILQCAAWMYLIGTAAATLAFEHYLIDLVVAVPYAYFAIRAAEGRFGSAFRNMGVVLAWLAAIRLATPLIAAHPWVLRLLVLATVGGGALSLRNSLCSASGTLPTVQDGEIQPQMTEGVVACAMNGALNP